MNSREEYRFIRWSCGCGNKIMPAGGTSGSALIPSFLFPRVPFCCCCVPHHPFQTSTSPFPTATILRGGAATCRSCTHYLFLLHGNGSWGAMPQYHVVLIPRLTFIFVEFEKHCEFIPGDGFGLCTRSDKAEAGNRVVRAGEKVLLVLLLFRFHFLFLHCFLL